MSRRFVYSMAESSNLSHSDNGNLSFAAFTMCLVACDIIALRHVEAMGAGCKARAGFRPALQYHACAAASAFCGAGNHCWTDGRLCRPLYRHTGTWRPAEMTEAYVRSRRKLTAHCEQCTQHSYVCQYVVAWHPCAATGCQISSSRCCSTRDPSGKQGNRHDLRRALPLAADCKVCGVLVTLHIHEAVACLRVQICSEAG